MSAERPTESIIDLLYGELSDEQERQVRKELAESADLQAEYAEFDGLLSRVREAMPAEDVSPSVHASILEAARIAANNAEGDDRLIRRTPPEAQGFWGRLGRGQGSQLALVAAVLVAGLFVVKFVDKSSDPLHAPAGNLSAMQEVTPAALPVDRSADRDETSAGGQEGLAAKEQAFGAEDAEELIAPSPDMVAAAEPPAEVQKSLEDGLEGSPAEEKPAAQRATETRRRAAPRPKKKSAAPASSVRPIEKSARDDKAELGMLNLFDGDGAGRGAQDDSNATPQAKGSAERSAPAPVQAEQEVDAEPRAYRAPANSISAVEVYFREGDYNGAIRAADQFLGNNENASQIDRASAMHVKAQALEKQGKYAQAERIYESLQKNYPAFRPDEINNARLELRRKNTKRQQRKPAPKVDAMEESYAPESTSY